MVAVKKMEVRLELFAFLDKYYPPQAVGQPCRVPVEPGVTARALVRELRLPSHTPVLVYVNERQLLDKEDRVLQGGDIVGVVPALPGG